MIDVNVVWWIVMLLMSFGSILLAYKLFGKTGLYIMTAISTIVVNIQVLKTVQLFGMVATLGNILYGTTLLNTDILSEIYGDKKSRVAVHTGMFATVVTMVTMYIALKFTPHESDFVQESLVTIFSIFPRVAIGSMVAYVLSQHHDVWAYAFWKKRFPKLSQMWIPNNFSTIVSQLIDSVVFCFIAFWGMFEMPVFIDILITTYFLKFIVALCDTPFLYIARWMYDNKKHNMLNIPE